MSTDLSRGLVVALLFVCSANLLVGVFQIGLLLRQPGGAPQSAGDPLASRFDPAAMAAIAQRVVDSYNREDFDGVYNAFDDVAKVSLTRETLEKQIKPMYELIGKIDSVAYESAEPLQQQGGLSTYELKYAVKLSGGRFNIGEMKLNVIDRGSSLGIYGFFVLGKM